MTINILGFVLTILFSTIILLCVQILKGSKMLIFFIIIYLIIGIILLIISFDIKQLRILLIIFNVVCILFLIMYGILIYKGNDKLNTYSTLMQILLIIIVTIITLSSLSI